MRYSLLSKILAKKAITTVRITVVIVCCTECFYQLNGLEIAPVKVFCPVYEPASVMVPGTAIPQYVVPEVGVEVAVGFGI
jgi:hypothetical protein